MAPQLTRIRAATTDDVGFMWEMLYYASHSNHETGVTLEHIKTNPDLTRHLAGWGRNGDHGLITESCDDGRPLGACWLRLFLPTESDDVSYYDADTPELVISVEPAHIGCGLGSELLRTTLAHADKHKIETIVLTARASNPAIELYERCGFATIETIANRVGSQSVKMLRRRGAS